MVLRHEERLTHGRRARIRFPPDFSISEFFSLMLAFNPNDRYSTVPNCRPGSPIVFQRQNHRGSLLFGWGRLFFLDKKFKGSFSCVIFEAVFTHFYQNIVINDQTFPLQLILMYLGVAYLDGVGKYFFQKMYGGSLIWKGSAIRHCRVAVFSSILQ